MGYGLQARRVSHCFELPFIEVIPCVTLNLVFSCSSVFCYMSLSQLKIHGGGGNKWGFLPDNHHRVTISSERGVLCLMSTRKMLPKLKGVIEDPKNDQSREVGSNVLDRRKSENRG